MLFSPFPIIGVVRVLRISSFPLLPRSLSTLLGALVGILPGFFVVSYPFLAFSLTRPATFSHGPRSLCFSSFSFSGIFLRGLLVSLRSFISGVFLFFCFYWEFVVFFCSCLFCLSCPYMRRFPLRCFLASFFSLFFHYGRFFFFFFFCLFVFTEVVTVLLFRCFCFGPVVSRSPLVSYVFCGVLLLWCVVF